jgi:phage terminase small subunit
LAEKAAKAAGLDVDRSLREIARVAYGDVRKLYREDGSLIPVHELDADTAAMVASIEHEDEYAGRGENRSIVGRTTKVKTWSKVEALEKASKVHGLYAVDHLQRGDGAIAALMAAVGADGAKFDVKA